MTRLSFFWLGWPRLSGSRHTVRLQKGSNFIQWQSSYMGFN